MRTQTVNNIKYILGMCDMENHQIIKKASSLYWWFHINDKPSGHCIVETDKLTDEIKLIACNYIKRYSKYKKDSKINFCYTQVKNVFLLDKPGLVNIKNSQLILLNYMCDIYKPFYLSNEDECIKYIEMCDYINNFINSYPTISIVTFINHIYDMYGFDKNITKQQIKMYMGEYKKCKSIKSPILKLLKAFGYDGVYTDIDKYTHLIKKFD